VAEERDEAWRLACAAHYREAMDDGLSDVQAIERAAAEIRAYRDQAMAETKTRAETAEGVIKSLKTESGLAALVTSRGWPLPEELAAAKERIKELEAQLASAHRLIRASGAAADAAEAGVVPDEPRVPRGFIEVHPCDQPQPMTIQIDERIRFVSPTAERPGCWIGVDVRLHCRESYQEVLEKIREAKR
jgi:hypothetical protein